MSIKRDWAWGTVLSQPFSAPHNAGLVLMQPPGFCCLRKANFATVLGNLGKLSPAFGLGLHLDCSTACQANR